MPKRYQPRKKIREPVEWSPDTKRALMHIMTGIPWWSRQKALSIIRQGPKVWNEAFAKVRLPMTIDLKGATFQGEDFKGIDLYQVKLHKVDFSFAVLSNAKLQQASLSEAILIKANLDGADLSRTGFFKANLGEASLREVDLSEAGLVEANLCGATLVGANLRKARLDKANLDEANLFGADLTQASLKGASLQGTDFNETSLVEADLSNANLTGAILYGTARDNWNIDNIECEYIFWDADGKERIPKERNFAPGEFEERYKQLPIFEYYFENGLTVLDTVIMSRVVQAINERRPEFDLKLDSFHSRGQPHAKFTVVHKNYVDEAFDQISAAYEAKVRVLEGKREQLLEVISMLASNPQPQLISRCEQVIIGGSMMGNNIKNIGRDNIEINGNAQIHQFTTGEGDVFQGDYAQKLLQTISQQSPREEIVKLLSFVQQELPKLPLPEEIKEEVTNEVKGAEIQVKKELPDKKKVADKLKNATEALKESAKTVKEAVMVGNLLGKAIEWCGEQWIEWMI